MTAKPPAYFAPLLIVVATLTQIVIMRLVIGAWPPLWLSLAAAFAAAAGCALGAAAARHQVGR